MKKFTLIFVVMLISMMSFAQLQSIKIPAHLQYTDTEKAGWYGNSSVASLSIVDPGYEYAIRVTAGALTTGDEITKVKFYSDHTSYASYGITNTSYTIKIYQGGSFDEENGYDVITACGTAVYSQNYTATTIGIQEVTLTTPYTIGTGEFWVSILCNGTSGIFLGTVDVSSANMYVSSMDYEGTDYWVNNEFCTDPPTCSTYEFKPFVLSLYVDDGGVYVENSDLTTFFLTSGTAPYTPIITELAIGETDDLVMFPAIQNGGPDATSNTIDLLVMAGTNELINETGIDLSGDNSLENGYFMFLTETGDLTLTAEDLNTLGLTGEFDVCITVTYNGVDNTPANNTACLTVTRGEVPVSNCDLQALFMTSNTNPTPIAATTTLGPTDGLTLYPGVKNNGPDNASTTATVAFTLDGTEVSSQSIPLTGLNNGMTAPLTTSGQTFTAEDMNTMGLTGTFEICMSITYDGTDAVAANNTTCLTVTRTTNVEANVASFVTMYPNPASSIVTITNVENSDITIVNMIGEVVAKVNNASSNQTIDISNLSNGTYFVKVDGKVFKLNVVK
ncbi:MAG TPA: T9SS type A sorting domain-containing protein [Bacteroidales bacterium]|nr:T9SS type A sorting domain-containing protein [Bacteroidales bacterium]